MYDKPSTKNIFEAGCSPIGLYDFIAPHRIWTQANSAVRIGIIGCGSRGTAVLTSMLQHTNTVVVAMLIFLPISYNVLVLFSMNRMPPKNFPPSRLPICIRAPKPTLNLSKTKDVDAVLISSPAYTHPEFLEAAIAAGKHVYCEKPVSPDVAGCKRIVKAGEKLNGKQSVVIGFQIRHASAYVGMVKKIQEGAIGEIVNGQLYYLSSATKLHDLKNVSDDEFGFAIIISSVLYVVILFWIRPST
jgi:hypothetical protein